MNLAAHNLVGHARPQRLGLFLLLAALPLCAEPLTRLQHVNLMPPRLARPTKPVILWGNVNRGRPTTPAGFTYRWTLTPDAAVTVTVDPASLTGTMTDAAQARMLAITPTFALANGTTTGRVGVVLTVTDDTSERAAETSLQIIGADDPLSDTPLKALEIDRKIAIENALCWLYARQHPDGFYEHPNTKGVDLMQGNAMTGCALWALGNCGHTLDTNPDTDIHQPGIAAGIEFLLRCARHDAIAVTPQGNPDMNGNGVGVRFGVEHGPLPPEWAAFPGDSEGYYRGMCIAALCAVTSPGSITTVAPFANGGAGTAFSQIVQDAAEHTVWCLGKNTGGGWAYQAMNNDAYADMSIASWNYVALEAARQFGAELPPWVFPHAEKLLAATRMDDGMHGYWPDGVMPTPATTASGISGMVFLGLDGYTPCLFDAGTARLKTASMFGSNWRGFGNSGNHGSLYQMWTVARALRMANLVHLNHPQGSFDWQRNITPAGDAREGFWPYLIRTQQPDGGWSEWYGDTLATAWGVLCLSDGVVGAKKTLRDITVTSRLPADPQWQLLADASAGHAPDVTAGADAVTLQWQLDELAEGGFADLSYDQVLDALVPGETRTVEEQVTVTYTSSERQLLEQRYGPLAVRVRSSSYDLSIAPDAPSFVTGQPARFTATVRLPPGQRCAKLIAPGPGSHRLTTSAGATAAATWTRLEFALGNPDAFPADATPVTVRIRTAGSETGINKAPWSDPLTASGQPLSLTPGTCAELQIETAPAADGTQPRIDCVSLYYCQAQAALAIDILDATDRTIGTAARLQLPASDCGSTRTFHATWENPVPAAAALHVRARIFEDAQTVAEARVPFAFTDADTPGPLHSGVRTERSLYGAEDEVEIIVQVTNRDPVRTLCDIQANLRLGPETRGDDTAEFATDYLIARLAPGESDVRRFTWRTGRTDPGTWRVRQTATPAGLQPVSAMTTFDIVASPLLNDAFGGQVSAEPPVVTQPQRFAIRSRIENTGNTDVTNQEFQVRVLSADDTTARGSGKTRLFQVAALPRTASASDQWTDLASAEFAPGEYVVLLQTAVTRDSDPHTVAATRLTVNPEPDTTPPTTAHDYALADRWSRNDVSIILTATDNAGGSGVKQTSFTVNGQTTTGTRITVTAEGTHAVTFHSDDNAGNTETDKTVTVRIDRTAPVTTVTDPSQGQWTNQDVELPFTATDDLSGVKQTTWTLGAVTQIGTSARLTAEGSQTITFRSEDNAGNLEDAKSATARIDKTPPVITHDFTGADTTLAPPVTVRFTATDALSGLAGRWYSVDGSAHTDGAQVTVTAEGAHNLVLGATDSAGNEQQVALAFKLQNTPAPESDSSAESNDSNQSTPSNPSPTAEGSSPAPNTTGGGGGGFFFFAQPGTSTAPPVIRQPAPTAAAAGISPATAAVPVPGPGAGATPVPVAAHAPPFPAPAAAVQTPAGPATPAAANLPPPPLPPPPPDPPAILPFSAVAPPRIAPPAEASAAQLRQPAAPPSRIARLASQAAIPTATLGLLFVLMLWLRRRNRVVLTDDHGKVIILTEPDRTALLTQLGTLRQLGRKLRHVAVSATPAADDALLLHSERGYRLTLVFSPRDLLLREELGDTPVPGGLPGQTVSLLPLLKPLLVPDAIMVLDSYGSAHGDASPAQTLSRLLPDCHVGGCTAAPLLGWRLWQSFTSRWRVFRNGEPAASPPASFPRLRRSSRLPLLLLLAALPAMSGDPLPPPSAAEFAPELRELALAVRDGQQSLADVAGACRTLDRRIEQLRVQLLLGQAAATTPPAHLSRSARAQIADAANRQGCTALQQLSRLQALCGWLAATDPERRQTAAREILTLLPAPSASPAELRHVQPPLPVRTPQPVPSQSAMPHRGAPSSGAELRFGQPDSPTCPNRSWDLRRPSEDLAAAADWNGLHFDPTTTLVDLSTLAPAAARYAALPDLLAPWAADITAPAASGANAAADLAANPPQTVRSDAVVALAQELATPTRIFEYFRNHFVYEPYFGAVKGTEQTLEEQAGNDADLASALISVLRASGVPCRYVYGTIRLTADQAAAWLGVSSTAVPGLLQHNHIPHRLDGGRPGQSDVLLDHVWVRACIDYHPYRGTVAEPGTAPITTGNAWIELDPSFKPHTFTARRDYRTDLALRPESFLANVRGQTTRGRLSACTGLANVRPGQDCDDHVTNLPQAFILNEITGFGTRLAERMNRHGLTLETVFRERRIAEQTLGLLPCTDLYPVVARGAAYASLPEALTGFISLTVTDPANRTHFTYSAPVAHLLATEVLFTAKPATGTDAEILTAWAQPAAQGQPQNAYWVNVCPRLLVAGVPAAESSVPVALGTRLTLTWRYLPAGTHPTLATKAERSRIVTAGDQLRAGDLAVMICAAGTVPATRIAGAAAQLRAADSVSPAQILRGVGLSYFYQSDRLGQLLAGALDLGATRAPSLLRVSCALDIDELFGQPWLVRGSLIQTAVLRDAFAVTPRDTDSAHPAPRAAAFTLLQGLTASALAANSLEQTLGVAVTSPLGLLLTASAAGTPLVTLIPQLDAFGQPSVTPLPASLPADQGITLAATARQRILDYLALGSVVSTVQQPVTDHGRACTALIATDPLTGDTALLCGTDGSPALASACELRNTAAVAAWPAFLLDPAAIAPATFRTGATDWLLALPDATLNSGIAYLPAMLQFADLFRTPEPTVPANLAVSALKLETAAIALIGRLREVSARPGVVNLSVTPAYVSPNGDGVQETLALRADLTRTEQWSAQLFNAATGTAVRTFAPADNLAPDTGTARVLNLRWDGRREDGQPPADGRYTVRITATAANTATATAETTFVLDTRAPTAEIAVTARTSAGRTRFSFAGTADDENLQAWQIDLCAAATGEPAHADPATPNSFPLTGTGSVLTGRFALLDAEQIPDGTWLARLTVHDRAGNRAVVRTPQTFTVSRPAPDTTPPEVRITGPVTAETQPLLTGEFPVTVTATDASGIAAITLYLDGSVFRQVNGSGSLEITMDAAALTPGVHTFSARATDSAGNVADSAACEFLTYREGGDPAPTANQPPLAAIANLAAEPQRDGSPGAALLTEGLCELRGTADDPDLADAVSWKIELFDLDGGVVKNMTPGTDLSGWNYSRVSATAAASGTADGAAPLTGTFGVLDFTLIQNGVYDLVLTVRGGSRSVSHTVRVALDSRLKIGQFGFSQQDVIIPAGGLPVRVIRTYNSLAAFSSSSSSSSSSSDFGPGWSYTMADLDLVLAEKRAIVNDVVGQDFSRRTGGGRDVTLTMPDGERVTFRFALEAGGTFSLGYRARWKAPPGIYAKLEPTCSDKLVALPSGMVYWEAGGPDTPVEAFDFPGFILTLKDGTRFRVDREDLGLHAELDETTDEQSSVQAYGKATLTRIDERTGASLRFRADRSGIDHFNPSGDRTRSIVFARNAAGRIVAVHDPAGLDAAGQAAGPAAVTYDYDADGRLIRVNRLVDKTVVPAKYASVTFVYGNAHFPNLITDIQDPLGRTPLRTEYDDRGRVIATIDALGKRTEVVHDLGARTETIYDRLGNPTLYAYDTRGNVTLTVDAQGNHTARTFDANGNQLTLTDPLGNTTTYTYDAGGNQTSVTDALGNATRFSYDAYGNVTETMDALGQPTRFDRDATGRTVARIDAFGQATTYQYDANGLLGGYVTPDGTSHLNVLTDFPQRLGLKTVSASGDVLVRWEEQFDSTGNLLARTTKRSLPDGTTRDLRIEFTYDAAGRVLRVENDMGLAVSYAYNETGKCVRTTSQTGEPTEYEYDACDRPTRMVLPDGKDVRRVYDANGQPVEMTGGGLSTCYSYDSLGRTRRITRNRNTGMEESTWYNYDACGRTVEERSGDRWRRYEYDDCGRTVRESDWTGASAETTYDATGRVVRVKAGNGVDTAIEHDGLGRRRSVRSTTGEWTQTEYNSAGQPARETRNDGTVVEREFDPLGNLVRVYLHGVDMSRKWFELRLEYDELGHVSRRTDALERTTAFAYDNSGRLLTETRPDGRTRSYEYNGARLVTLMDFDKRRTVVEYDSLGRPTRTCITAGNNAATSTKEFRYDNEGRLSEIQDARGTSFITYDPFGRVTSRHDPITGTVWYDWDAGGRCQSVRTATHKVDYTYDRFGRMGIVRSGSEVATITYATNGLSESVTYPNGMTRLYDYDPASRVARVSYANTQTGADVAWFTAEYDPIGRCVRTASDDGLAGLFAYNEVGMLSSESWADTSRGFRRDITYEYDACGNRTRMVRDGESVNYSYASDGDRLLSTDSGVAGKSEFEYDDYGALTLITQPDGTRTHLAYDTDRQLVGCRQSRNHGELFSIIYGHDTWGNRIAETVSTPAGTVSDRRFRFDAMSGAVPFRFEQYENGATGSGTGHVRGPGGMLWTRGLPTGTAGYYLTDTSRSVRRVLDQGSDVTAKQDFDAFGNPLANVTMPGSDFGYRGEVQDARTGLVHLRARDYLPDQGRFNGPDLLDGDPSSPLSLHRYAYANNDPVQYSDPTGLFSLTEAVSASTIQSKLVLPILMAGRRVRGQARVTMETAIANQMYQMVFCQEPAQPNASLIVHGVIPDGQEFGWSQTFTSELRRRGVQNQDFYEFRWSGFQFGSALGYEACYAFLTAYCSGSATDSLFGVTLRNLDRIDAIATESLTRTMDVVQGQGYANVNVISHSWGTFLSHRMLFTSDAPVTEWFTMGSPLGANAAVEHRPGGIVQWHNAYSILDLVCAVAPFVATTTRIRGNTGDSSGGQLYTVAVDPSVTVDTQLDIDGGSWPPPSSWWLSLVDPALSVAKHQSYWENLLMLDAIHNRLKKQPK